MVTSCPMGYGFGGGSFGGGYLGMFIGIIFWILIIAGVVWLVIKLTKNNQNNQDHKHDPLEILKARYAKGEIDKKEFEDMNKELEK